MKIISNSELLNKRIKGAFYCTEVYRTERKMTVRSRNSFVSRQMCYLFRSYKAIIRYLYFQKYIEKVMYYTKKFVGKVIKCF